MVNYVFLTTSIVSIDNFKLERMLNSIRVYADNPRIKIRHILLLQNVSIEKAEELRESLRMPDWTELLVEPNIISLSKARNIMLDSLHYKKNEGTDIVAFPDDDSWYPEGLIINLANIFRKTSCDLFFCRYGSNATVFTEDSKLQEPSYRDLIFNASSNTLFIRADIVRKIGFFDERLGVGAKYNGGEDLDYAVRAFRVASKSIWCDRPLVGHRDKMEGLKGNYFTGSARVLRANAFYSPSAMFHFLRKMLIGSYLVIRGDMPISRFLKVFEKGDESV